MRTYPYLIILLTGFLFLTSCDKDDDITPEPATTIIDIAAGDAQFSTLVSALERTGLVSTLEGDGPFTVFAPTNAAFEQSGVDLAALSDNELRNILLYHVVPGEVRSNDLQDGQTYAATASTDAPGANQLSMLIEKSPTGIELNGTSTVTNGDVVAGNGVIHVINNILIPLDIVGHAAANENFSSLVTALTTAPGDLVNVLSGSGPFTVFAPLNSGFEAISETVQSLSAEQLSTVLTYHVIGNANVRSEDLTSNMVAETVSGQTFTIDLEGGPMITDQTGSISNIILTDVQTTNGVIHVLEKVLIPNL